MMKRARTLLPAAALLALVLPAWAGAGSKGPDAAAVYAKSCAGCHGAKLVGGFAPALNHEGKKRTAPWILAQINNPKVHKKDSSMPGAAALHLSAAQAQALTVYLARMK